MNLLLESCETCGGYDALEYNRIITELKRANKEAYEDLKKTNDLEIKGHLLESIEITDEDIKNLRICHCPGD